MIRAVSTVFATTAMLAGCAPFAVNWYQVQVQASATGATVPSPEDDVVLVILNRSDQSCTLNQIRLNAIGPDAAGYTRAVTAVLLPGQMYTTPLKEFKRDPILQCSLPLKVEIETSGCGFPDKRWVQVTLPPRLPNALPDLWLHCDLSNSPQKAGAQLPSTLRNDASISPPQ